MFGLQSIACMQNVPVYISEFLYQSLFPALYMYIMNIVTFTSHDD